MPAAGPVRSSALENHLDDLKMEQAQKALDFQDRRKRRLKAHSITGAITFFLLQLLLGLPMSLTLGPLVANAIFSTLVGSPLGFLISWLGGGRYRGMWISMAAFFVVLVPTGIPSLFEGGTFGGLLAAAAVRCPAGALPGYVIGLHVEVDD